MEKELDKKNLLLLSLELPTLLANIGNTTTCHIDRRGVVGETVFEPIPLLSSKISRFRGMSYKNIKNEVIFLLSKASKIFKDFVDLDILKCKINLN